MKNIILASTSPRRKELMRGILGDSFQILPSNYEEDNSKSVDTKELVKEHALGKARDVAMNNSEGIVIGADNLVVCEGKVMGKPKDENDAKEMLSLIQDNTLQVLGGIAVIDASSGEELQYCEVTDVYIRAISYEEIEKYVSTGEPMDKAGAFAAQGKGALFIEGVNGCFNNVVGLSLYRLEEMLKQLEISLVDMDKDL